MGGCARSSPNDIPSQREVISSPDAPEAIGPYSQAVRAGDLLFLSGQVGIDPSVGRLVEGGVEAETRQALENLSRILESAGFDLADAVQVQVFLSDLDDYAAVNAVYAEYFGEAPPARAVVGVARLPLDARVEIMLTAAR